MSKNTICTTMRLSCSLPYPPSVNSIWGKAKGHIYLKPKAEAFLNEVVPKLRVKKNIAGWTTMNQKTIVEYKVRHPDNREHDCDNLFKLIGDSIEKSGIVTNDNLLLPRCMDFTVDKENPGVEVSIYVFTGN